MIGTMIDLVIGAVIWRVIKKQKRLVVIMEAHMKREATQHAATIADYEEYMAGWEEWLGADQ